MKKQRERRAGTFSGETSFPSEQCGEQTWEGMRKPWRRNLRSQLCKGNPAEKRIWQNMGLWSEHLWREVLAGSGKGDLAGRARLGTRPKLPGCQAERGTWSTSLLSTWLMSKLLAGSGKGAPVIYLIPPKLPPRAPHTHFDWAQIVPGGPWRKGLLGDSFCFFVFPIWLLFFGCSCPLTEVAIKTKLQVAS